MDIFPKDKAQGDKIFKWCIQNADKHDIVEVIWHSQIWTPGRGKCVHGGAGKHPHTDHVHLSLKKLPGYGL